MRGLGAPSEKSLELLSVSAQPSDILVAAVVLLRVGTGPLPSKQFAVLPKPTKSIMFELGSGQVPERTGVPGRVTAIFPESPSVIGGDGGPVATTKSGVGNAAPLEPFAPNWINICWPGWMRMPLMLVKEKAS